MSANFLSVPTKVCAIIWDYCEAKEIMALTCTCRTFHSEIESFMLVVDAAIEESFRSEIVPIFFAEMCHSVFMICEAYDIFMALMSRKREQNGQYDTRHWARNCMPRDKYHIAFRNDPSRQYLLLDDQRHDKNEYKMTLRKQFMRSTVTPAMKLAVAACLNLGKYKPIVHDPMSVWAAWEMTRFRMNQIIFGCMSLSEVPSPVLRSFRSQRSTKHLENATISLFQKRIVNFFERILEQMEPSDCVKRALLSDEWKERSRRRAEDVAKEKAQTFGGVSLLLKQFTWKWNKRRHIDQEEGKLFNDDLVFIARIPLEPEITSIRFGAWTEMDSPTSLFVVFFQKRQNGLDNLENSIDGQVFTVKGNTLKSEYDVNPDDEACFLYFVPDNITRMELQYLSVTLQVVLDEPNQHLWFWMSEFNGTWSSTGCHDLVPITLLRDGALALIKGADQELYRAWKDTFFMRRLDSTPEFLANIVDVCNALLQCEACIWH